MSTQTRTMESRGVSSRQEIRRKLRQKSKVPGYVAWTKWMNSHAKNHVVAFIGEFVGTTRFLIFAFAGTQTANINLKKQTRNVASGVADLAALLYISMSFGFSLMVNAWVFFRISVGLFNPAVTLALTLNGDLQPIRAILIFVAQICGGYFAAYLVKVMFPSPLAFGTTLSPGTTIAEGLWIEAICTASLVLTIIMLAKEKHRATFIAPIGIGLSLFISQLVAVYYTGGSLNPARSFGPGAVGGFLDTQWIYWVGPFIGSLLAVGFFRLMKMLEYEMANAGQDGDPENDPTMNPEHEVAAKVENRKGVVAEIRVIEKAGGFHTMQDDHRSQGVGVLGDGGVTPFSGGKKEGNEVRVQEVAAHEFDLEAQ